MTLQTLTIKKPSDLHTHVRQGDLLPEIARITAKNFAYIEIMPNTTPAKLTGPEAIAYGKEVEQYTPGTKVIPSIKITAETTPEMVKKAVELGVKVGKIYYGITTNETEGARGIEPFMPALKAAEEYGMIVLIHGEMAYKPDGSKIINLRREEAFLPIAQNIVMNFPKLKIVFEHITTKAMVDFVVECHRQDPGRIAATITVQHLQYDIDGVLGFVGPEGGEGINVHNYCKPVLKYPEDRAALIWAATSGLICFFFGSDSAPHTTENKYTCCGKPGVFSALTRIETLAEIFEKEGVLETRFEGFISIYGPKFYGLPETTETITLVKKPWKVPQTYVGVTNYRENEEIQWKVEEVQ